MPACPAKAFTRRSRESAARASTQFSRWWAHWGSSCTPKPVKTDQGAQLLGQTVLLYAAHAAEEIEDENLSILDIENIILTGKIVERQRDAKTREIKCVVAGATPDGAPAEVVVKIGITGKLIVIATYLC
jgi:hypothetical protein